jgi:hypothetical protein
MRDRWDKQKAVFDISPLPLHLACKSTLLKFESGDEDYGIFIPRSYLTEEKTDQIKHWTACSPKAYN